MIKIKIYAIIILLLLTPLSVLAQESGMEVSGELATDASVITESDALEQEPAGDELEDDEIVFEDDGLISVDFQNCDINQVIKVLGDITGTVIIPHDELQGKINVVSLDKVEPEVVSHVLESVLMTKGFTLIKSGAALKVVPLPETKQTSVAVKIGVSPAGISDQDVVITQVMPVKYSSALKLKTILQPLVGKHGNIIANERTNTLIITDLSSNIRRLATIIDQMERPLPSDTQVKTFVLNYGDAEKISEILNDLSQEGRDEKYPVPEQIITDEGAPLEIYGAIGAFAEKETGSIVVTSAPINFPAIERLIKKLDVFPPQAMIEVIIMDVTLDDDFAMGIEFGDATSPTLTTKGYKTDLDFDTFNESTFHSLLGLATDAGTAGFTYRILNESETIEALAFILDSQENSKVLSTPKILASNNQESSITVGQEIPIIESSTTDLANNVTNVDYRYENIGLNMKVTPRISRDGYVNMKIHAELKDLSAQTLFGASIINTREADATIIIPDGHTVVLGGLMRDNNSVVEKKIPLLGDIPFLGVLFKKTKTSLFKTELIIFLRPHIIKNTADLEKISAEPIRKMQRIKAAQSSSDLKKAVREALGYKSKEDLKKKSKKK
ncbi:MAG: hypothetical protein KAR05_02630 [Candidatus Omnitrophica bacterium]|nr:hypothetical protein [Candidatus Omnitrophota bacterium]